jgi:hypothetical protein
MKRHVTHKKIADLLAQGKEVRSAAAGRVGKVVEVIEGMVKVQFGPRYYGVTWFNHGDEVVLVENDDGTFTIRNVPEQDELMHKLQKVLSHGKHLYELLGKHFGDGHAPWEQLTAEERAEWEQIAAEVRA